MVPVPGFQFDRLLRAMDAESFERFVADLWRARGWTVERKGAGEGKGAGDVLVVDHPTRGERRTIEVRAVPRWRPRAPSNSATSADVAVVNRRVPGESDGIVDARDLRDMVRYAVDPATRAELFEAHLDRSGSLTGLAIRRVPPVAPIRVAAVVVALTVALAAAAAGLAFLPGDEPASGLAEAGESTALPDGEVDLDSPEGFAATQWPGSGGGYPPGLDPSGITDPAALASTHAQRAGDRPYELTLTVRELEGDRPVGSYEERIAVRSDWTFATSIDSSGDLRADHVVVSAVGMYSAGNGVFVHVDPERSMDPQTALRASPGDVAGIENRVEKYLVDVLSVNESAVVQTTQIGDTTLHRVNGTHAGPDGGTERVTALVTAGGTVREVRVERVAPGTDRPVVVTLEYDYGDVSVAPPPWLGDDSVTAGRNLPISKR